MTTDGPNPPAPFPGREGGERVELSSPPSLPGKGAGGLGSSRSRLHLLVLLVFLGLWTWKLLEPNPVPEAISEKLKGDARFVAAKSLHAGGYAFLTLLAVTL